MKRLFYLIISLLLVFVSCEQDNYEKGEGSYSLLRGDFGEIKVNDDCQAISAITDDQDQLTLKDPYSAKWIATPDTTYRCILYYNKVGTEAEVVSLAQVPCPAIIPLNKFEQEVRTDPVKLESIWLSKSGKYLNLSLQIKTGLSDDTTAVQHLAFVADTLLVNPDETRTLYLRLHHDQGNVPEYYSTQSYASLLTSNMPADSVRLTINTYAGLIVRTFQIHKR